MNDVDEIALLRQLASLRQENERLKTALSGHLFDGESVSLREAIRSELIVEQSTRLAETEAKRKQLETAYLHALACVDRVFQGPDALLPDFLELGEDKFKGVEKLAKAYSKLIHEEPVSAEHAAFLEARNTKGSHD